MSWRTVVITGSAKLDFKMDYLVVRKQEGTNRIHLSEIGLLMVESTAISLTTALLSELVKHKVKVVFCDEKHNPQSELLPYYGSHDTSVKVKRQTNWEEEIKKSVWTEIVTEKIRDQRHHLEERGNTVQAEMLAQYIRELKFGDETNREGHAAKVYFNSLFGMDFTRSEDNPINAALNYGYGLLLSYFNREVVANGYITQLGLFHDNMFNQFNLASDLMEPFRIIVDRKVIGMTNETFEHSEKLELIFMMNDEVQIDGKWNTISNAIKIYCRSIFDALNENDISLIRFYKYEF
ncbi:type II CRISPR-associated endonuclease Cas1 [Aminicella lysinilytica]|uniref:CRISPR-associated endonuclease Cas1 n=1 Tax=Aminicella lysinilytica TaxID=433323 RepID=A0A4R6PZQ9_9FIRM|nr:type II CRISPR-associated endonuclease Cas1 [Aminicella lysinilytica]TDP53017.1 CRISPR-associated Cas1 family protein [Aminicella lysinilytica]